MALKFETRPVALKRCRPQAVNARYMTKDEYDRLVHNVRADGGLTSTPLLYWPPEQDDPDILSGHHRIKAAMEALGDDTVQDCVVILDQQSRDEIIARQLSHNSIVGHDDPALLKELWEEIEDVDWREYAALDDKTQEWLDKVDLGSLGEANLDILTVQFMFLPTELDRAQAMFERIDDLFKVDERYVAEREQWSRLIDALDSSRGAHDIKNSAAAFGVLLDVVDAHIGDLYAGWYDEQEQVAKHDKWVPTETVVGSRDMPAEAAAIVVQALDKALKDADLPPNTPRWRALELLAADYLAGA